LNSLNSLISVSTLLRRVDIPVVLLDNSFSKANTQEDGLPVFAVATMVDWTRLVPDLDVEGAEVLLGRDAWRGLSTVGHDCLHVFSWREAIFSRHSQAFLTVVVSSR
jgi:hypothetical protein